MVFEPGVSGRSGRPELYSLTLEDFRLPILGLVVQCAAETETICDTIQDAQVSRLTQARCGQRVLKSANRHQMAKLMNRLEHLINLPQSVC